MNLVFRAFCHSCDGLHTAWAEDRSFRRSAIQVAIASAIALGLYLGGEISLFSALFLLGAAIPILIVETINTAIEAVTDKASPERHPLAKKAKDIGSAAVLITRAYAILCWAAILLVAHDW
jgi:diacylglycerol kinase (ATP)